MLIDSHCHLPHEIYTKPLSEIIYDAKVAGVEKLINIGTSLQENDKTLAVSAQYDNVFSAIGIYPHEELNQPASLLEKGLKRQLESGSKIVAIGECGLDITERKGGRKVNKQIELFEMQLQLAVENKLPVVIHNRGGDELIFNIIDKFIGLGLTGVAHCFASTQKVAEHYLTRGFYISFSGMLTYKNKYELCEVAKNVPLDKFMFETDAPYLTPQGFRGQTNEPKYIVEVAKKFAQLRDMPFDKISELSYSNTYNLLCLETS